MLSILKANFTGEKCLIKNVEAVAWEDEEKEADDTYALQTSSINEKR